MFRVGENEWGATRIVNFFQRTNNKQQFPEQIYVTLQQPRGLPAVSIPLHQYGSLIAQYSPYIKNCTLLTALIFQDYVHIFCRIFSQFTDSPSLLLMASHSFGLWGQKPCVYTDKIHLWRASNPVTIPTDCITCRLAIPCGTEKLKCKPTNQCSPSFCLLQVY